MSTPSDGLRQGDRISLRMPVEVAWATAQGATFSQTVETLLVSRNGGVLRFTEKLEDGQELHLRRHIEGDQWKNTRARVVAEIDQDANGFLYAIHILEPRNDFWDIDFPSPHKGEEALARLLMECSFCQRREVVYLNELELKSFESRKCVARICKVCEAPSIWVEAQSELVLPESQTARGSEVGRFAATHEDDRILPRRNRTRVEVAVPFTPGSGAIFVPIRIVFSQPIPSAGLFRHGAAYLKPPE